jgi:peptide chain release factor subunit 1
MITEALRDELVNFDGGEHPVLSVYLDLGPDRQVQRRFQAAYDDLVDRCTAELSRDERQAVLPEFERVGAYLRDIEPQGRGLALFSCTPCDFWRAHFTQLPLRDDIFVNRKPYLRPLLSLMDEHERYAVALVDKEKARILAVNMAQIEDEIDIADDVPSKHDQGGWSQSRYQRAHDNAVMHHLKHVVDGLDELHARQPFRRLVILGPEEATTELQNMLSSRVKDTLVAVRPGEFFGNQAEMLQRTTELMQSVEREMEERIVTQLLEFTGAGGRGARGLSPVLDALWNGQVDTLIVADDIRMAGGECVSCGRIVASGRTTCPSCNSRMLPLDDVVERAIQRTLGQSGAVEVVHGAAADRLRAAGGIGAMLRFTIAPASEHTTASETT